MASVSKRPWQAPDGTMKEAWQVRYYDTDGKRRGKQFTHKKLAMAFKLKVEIEIEQGSHVAERASPTIATVADEYLKQAGQRRKDGRIGTARYDSIKSLLLIHVIPDLGAIRFKDLTAVRMEEFYQALVEKGLVPYVCRDRIGDFRLVEQFAIRRGYTKAQPVAEALRELRGITRTRIRTFTMQEAGRVLATAGARVAEPRYRRHAAVMDCAVNLAAFCGLRRGEIFGMGREHVDFERRLIHVRRSVTQKGEVKGPKTAAGVRDVPMPPRVARMVEAFASEHYLPNKDGFIFTSDQGGKVNSGNFHTAWTKLMKAAELHHEERPFHFHALRHFAASWMIENGAPLTDTANLLGHAKFDMTLQVYAHSVISPHLRHDLMDRMAANLIIPTGTAGTSALLTN